MRDEITAVVERESLPKIRRAMTPFFVAVSTACVLAFIGMVWAAESPEQLVLSLSTGVLASTLTALAFFFFEELRTNLVRFEAERLTEIILAARHSEEE